MVRLGFNPYRIEGQTAYFQVSRRNGEVVEVLIDLSDLEKLVTLNRRWSLNINDGKIKAIHASVDNHLIRLSRFITDAPEGMVIDHINRNPLDNRKNNLRIITQAQNSRNRSLSKNNSIGTRGVHLKRNSGIRRYEVTLGDCPKVFRGTYSTRNIASITACLARAQYWGHTYV